MPQHIDSIVTVLHQWGFTIFENADNRLHRRGFTIIVNHQWGFIIFENADNRLHLRGFTIIVNHQLGFTIFENAWFSLDACVHSRCILLTLVADIFMFCWEYSNTSLLLFLKVMLKSLSILMG